MWKLNTEVSTSTTVDRFNCGFLAARLQRVFKIKQLGAGDEDDKRAFAVKLV
jgi:hypothetical protein